MQFDMANNCNMQENLNVKAFSHGWLTSSLHDSHFPIQVKKERNRLQAIKRSQDKKSVLGELSKTRDRILFSNPDHLPYITVKILV